MTGICVFCGSLFGDDEAYEAAAAEMGRLIAEQGWRFVFGGGSVGLMGVSSRAAIRAGGHVTGIIPEFLRNVEAAHTEVTDMHVVNSMHVRKQMMFDMSDAFVVLPGGLGTLDELVEMTTWAQLQRHVKPILLVDVLNYWEPYDALIDAVVAKGFAHPMVKRLYSRVPSPQAAIAHLKPVVAKAA